MTFFFQFSYPNFYSSALTFTVILRTLNYEKGYLLSFVFLITCLYFSTMLILWVRKCEYWVLEIMRDTKVLSSHSSSTRDLRLLYHLWSQKPHTYISYSQYFHSAKCMQSPGTEVDLSRDVKLTCFRRVFVIWNHSVLGLQIWLCQ